MFCSQRNPSRSNNSCGNFLLRAEVACNREVGRLEHSDFVLISIRYGNIEWKIFKYVWERRQGERQEIAGLSEKNPGS